MLVDMILEVNPQPTYGVKFSLGKTYHQLTEKYFDLINKYEREIDFVADNLSRKNVSELEKLATALYITKNRETDGSVQQRANRINEIKPHVSIEEAEEALKKVDEWIGNLGKLQPA